MALRIWLQSLTLYLFFLLILFPNFVFITKNLGTFSLFVGPISFLGLHLSQPSLVLESKVLKVSLQKGNDCILLWLTEQHP